MKCFPIHISDVCVVWHMVNVKEALGFVWERSGCVHRVHNRRAQQVSRMSNQTHVSLSREDQIHDHDSSSYCRTQIKIELL